MDIKVSSLKVKGKEWLKSQVSRAFLPKYFPNYKKYLWIDCDAWVSDWTSVELYFKACDKGKLVLLNQLDQDIEYYLKSNGYLVSLQSLNLKILNTRYHQNKYAKG